MLDKPPGLPSHPGPRGGASAEDWFPFLSRRRDGPWLAHRLDADTAGCLLVALRKQALIEAQRCLGGTDRPGADGRRAEKRYWAVVRGHPPGERGTVSRPLHKRSDRTGWRMVADPGGQEAVTDWRLLGESGDGTGEPIAWLELLLRTGRTHQARVHCATLGCPVLGDGIYGKGNDRGGGDGTGLHLLARSLMLPLDPPVAAVAPPPPHMLAALERCGFSPPAGNR